MDTTNFLKVKDKKTNNNDGVDGMVKQNRTFTVGQKVLHFSKPCFIINIVLLTVSIGVLIGCIFGFLPMTIQRRLLHESLGDTKILLEQCYQSLQLQQEKEIMTLKHLQQCNIDKQEADKLIQVQRNENYALKNQVTDLSSKLKYKENEVGDLSSKLKHKENEVGDLLVRLDQKANVANSAAWGWGIFNSAMHVRSSLILISSSVFFALVLFR